MAKRYCKQCDAYLPPYTEHFLINYDFHCTDCVEVRPYTSYSYYILGEYVGGSEDGDIEHVEEYEDEYEDDEEAV